MPLGIYLHAPFCVSKCPYCDFYSIPLPDSALLDVYTHTLIERMRLYKGLRADTLYFGGGTPSLLGGKRLAALIDAAADCFGLSDAEITLEANPGDGLHDTLHAFFHSGGNRVSFGMQCGDEQGLRMLGRRHTPQDFLRSVQTAHDVGIDNISADWMLALPGETEQVRQSSLHLLQQAQVRHVSAYLLKTEPGTPFFARKNTLHLPTDEQAADQYLGVCRALEQIGFMQYEISNFAHPDFHSRHNLKYWDAQPYLGFGPSAHSFFDGQRFAYPPSLQAFLDGTQPESAVQDPRIPDGSEQEYLMLRLRLTAGLDAAAFTARFGKAIPDEWKKRAQKLPQSLIHCDGNGIRLTRRGFLLSNEILRRLLQIT